MKHILILCEGQTEQTFVKRVLAPHFQHFDKHITPIVLKTKKEKSGGKVRGGVSSYAKIRSDIRGLLRDRHATCVTTMLDYYGLPGDFPGKNSIPRGTPYDRVEHLEQAFAEDIEDRRFVPFLMLHEFEALLFVDLSVVREMVTDSGGSQGSAHLPDVSNPEEINDGQDTHPSARLKQLVPGYGKVLHGPRAVERIGLVRIRNQCPHFDGWLKKLEAL